MQCVSVWVALIGTLSWIHFSVGVPLKEDSGDMVRAQGSSPDVDNGRDTLGGKKSENSVFGMDDAVVSNTFRIKVYNTISISFQPWQGL